MDKMKLQELIKLFHEYNEKKISGEEFIDRLNSVYVNAYLPLSAKIANVMNVLFGFEYSEENIIEKYMQLEMNKFWYIIMPYANIEIEYEYVNEENYELLFSTLNSAIRHYAEKDIEETLRLMDRIISDARYGQLISIFKDLTGNNFEELIKADNEVVKALTENPDLISNLLQLSNHINPTIEKFNKNIEKETVKNINKTKE